MRRKRMRRRFRKQSKESRATSYYARALRRFVRIAFWWFVLFLFIMGIIWAVPKVWNWAFG